MSTRKPLEDFSQVIGVSEVARRFGRSRDWARALLVEWFEMQKHGGDTRVFSRTVKNRVLLFTTLAVLNRHMPPGRDEALVRKVKELERDIDHLASRLDGETTARLALERKLEAILRGGARRAG